jgi:WD40 repeat protein
MAPTPVIPEYELQRRIGSGSYGEVWLARGVTGFHRAVKLVYRERFQEDRPFEREFAGIRRFEPISRSQANLVDILHVGRKDDQGCFYYVMELADSAEIRTETEAGEIGSSAWVRAYHPKTLREVLARRGRLPVEECLPIAVALARAVEHLHRHRLVHRDIKPSNIIFVDDTPKLADIGLVAGVAESCSFVGTEGFVPPEGPGTPAADLFSLGKLLYEMSNGRDRLDFPKLPAEFEIISDRRALLEFNEVVLKACQPEPRARYASATEMLEELLLLQAGRSVKRLRAVEKRLARVVPAGIVLAGLAAVALTVQYFRTKDAQRLAQVEVHYRRQAEEQALATRQLLYAADMNLAHQAFAAADLGRVQALLAAQVPKPGEVDLRGFEWRYYSALSRGDQLFTFPAQANAVAALAFSPDDHLLASAGYDHQARLWEVGRRQPLVALPTVGAVEDLAFSPDGRQLLTSDQSGLVQAREIRSGHVTFQLNTRFRHMAVSMNGSLLALGGGGKKFIVDQAPAEVWNYESNRQLFSLPDAGTYIAFSPDGRLLATGSRDRKIKLWDLQDGHLLLHLGPVERNLGMSFFPDGDRIAVGDELGSLSIWDTATGRRVTTVQAHAGGIFKTAVSPDGKLLASVGADQTVRLWNSDGLSEVATLRGHISEVWGVAFSHDSRLLASSGKDGTVRFWNPAPESRTDLLSRRVAFWHWPVFSPDGRWLAAGIQTPGVAVWRASDGTPAGDLAGAQRPLAFLTNATALLTLGTNGELQCWSLPATNSLPLWQRQLGATGVFAHVFLPERSLLATGDRGGKVRLWDIQSNAEMGHWQAGPSRIVSMAVSPDRSTIATASEGDAEVRLWSQSSHQLKATLRGHKLEVYSVAFSPDGRSVATASVDDTAGLWDAQTGELLALLTGHKGGTYSVAFSADGNTLVVGCNEGELKLWNLQTRRDMMTLQTERHVVFSASFAPGGHTLATVSFNHHNQDCSLKLWHAPELAERTETGAARPPLPIQGAVSAH